MTYQEWLEKTYRTDDAEARKHYEEKDSFVGTFRPWTYQEWMKRYGYADTATAQADYAEYQKQLDILTPEKRKPGRPATGNAMTPAEKQSAYRERQKKREAELEGIAYEYREVCKEKLEVSMKLIKTEVRVVVLERQLAEALAEIERLKGGADTTSPE
jgi:hypothetical protein